MAITYRTCPKCGHTRSANDNSDMARCPACGLYFAKWVTREQFVPAAQRNQEDFVDETGWFASISERLHHVPEGIDTLRLYGSAVLLALLLLWSYRLHGFDYRDGEINTSFMHAILLPIHEAGHMLFMPFGEFMMILGGSLFQLVLPLICAGTLFWQNRDTFGTGIGLWWVGVSVLDLAPYIYDAKEPQLMLLGGHTGEDGPHDWIYLLDVFHRVQASQTLGAHTHTVGTLVMIAGALWSAHTLYRWHVFIKNNNS